MRLNYVQMQKKSRSNVRDNPAKPAKGAAVRQRILALCRERGITVNRLSYLCGITQSTLQNIIGGRNKSMTVSTLKKICDGFELSLRDFFDDPLFSSLEQEVQ